MKIRSAVPEDGCLVFLWRTEKTKNKTKRNICKTYTHPPHRRLRKLAKTAQSGDFASVYNVRKNTILFFVRIALDACGGVMRCCR